MRVSIGTRLMPSFMANWGGISRCVKTDDSLATMVEYKFYQYPRGVNKGGVLNTQVCPTISCSSWENNCLLLEMEELKIVSYSRDSKGKTQNKHLNEIANTIHASTGSGGNTDCFVAEPKVEQVGNIYPDTENFKNRTMGRVYSDSGLSPTINCCGGGDREPKIIITDNGNNETKGIYTESNETNTQKILQILREEVGEETCQWAIGRLVSIFKAEILRQRVYEEGICKDRETLSRIQPSASHIEGNSLFDTGKGKEVRDMRCDTEYRCASQGFQLSEQFAREFNDIMSQLPYKTASTEECVSYMWQTCKGTQLMQQTLHTLEEVWRPTTQTLEYIQPPKYRIRKLTCREAFRLMDVSEEDIDKIQSAGISNSQQYKMAGNSIVVSCLYHIFRTLFVEKENPDLQMTIFDIL